MTAEKKRERKRVRVREIEKISAGQWKGYEKEPRRVSAREIE